jgi:hypothetical protein
VKANPFAWALRATVIVALASYAAFIAGWLLGRQVVGDTWWPLAVLNSFPALAFMPLPATLIAALLLRSRVGWALAAIPLVLWLGLFGWRFLPRAAGGSIRRHSAGDDVQSAVDESAI